MKELHKLANNYIKTLSLNLSIITFFIGNIVNKNKKFAFFLSTLLIFLATICLFTSNTYANTWQTKLLAENTQTLSDEQTIEQDKQSLDNDFSNKQKKLMAESQSTSFGWSNYFQAIGIMLFLLLMLWYVLRLVRKFGNGRFLPSQKLLPKDTMYLEAQLPFGPNRFIAIVKVLDERLLLAITENNISLIKELSEDNKEMVENNEEDYAKIFEEQLQKPE